MKQFWEWMKSNDYGIRFKTKNGYSEYIKEIGDDQVKANYRPHKLALVGYMIKYISLHVELYNQENDHLLTRLSLACNRIDIYSELKTIIKLLDKE